MDCIAQKACSGHAEGLGTGFFTLAVRVSPQVSVNNTAPQSLHSPMGNMGWRIHPRATSWR
jgi:hypothetical protein